MSTAVTRQDLADFTAVYLHVEADEVMAIGKRMEAIDEQAYMNGYNWEAFLNLYMEINQPELLRGLDTDSEAGTYVALYDKAEAGKADRLATIINSLLSNPEEIYSFLKEYGEDIEWD